MNNKLFLVVNDGEYKIEHKIRQKYAGQTNIVVRTISRFRVPVNERFMVQVAERTRGIMDANWGHIEEVYVVLSGMIVYNVIVVMAIYNQYKIFPKLLLYNKKTHGYEEYDLPLVSGEVVL